MGIKDTIATTYVITPELLAKVHIAEPGFLSTAEPVVLLAEAMLLVV